MTNEKMNGAINRKANIGENREISNGSDLKDAEQDSQFFGELPKGWILKKFGDILSEPVRNGIYKKKEFHGRGQKIINMGELFAHNFISNQEMKRVELNPNEVSKSIVQDGDLLFARRSLVLEGSGKCSLVVHPSENLTFESSIIRAIPDRTQADSRFYYYLFQSRLGRALIASIATQTAVSGITGSNLMMLKMPQPPLLEQRKIASILSAYDDLIENNTRRIKILEEMAQALYREWFVKFRFPGHEKVRMVESEIGRVPEGWEIKKLGDIVKNVRISVKPGPQTLDLPYVPIDCLPRISLALSESKPGSEAQSSLFSFKKYDILFGAMRSYFHKVVIAPFDGTTRSTCFVLRPIEESNYSYAVLTLFEESTVSYSSKHSRGTTIPYAVWDGALENMPIVMPPEELRSNFNRIVKPILERIAISLFRQANLRRTRDLLLPKLISGEVDVEKIDVRMAQ